MYHVHAGADYEAAHDAVARQAETAMNGRAAPPASQQGLPMAPQRPPGAAPPGMAPPAGAYGSPRVGAGGPPSGAPPSYSLYPGEPCVMAGVRGYVLVFCMYVRQLVKHSILDKGYAVSTCIEVIAGTHYDNEFAVQYLQGW